MTKRRDNIEEMREGKRKNEHEKKNVRACVAGNGTLNCARVEIVLMNGKINNSISDRFLPLTRADDDYST